MLTRAGRHREGTRNRAADWDVPGYTELKTLGSGGSGDVVLARHDRSGALVAVKYLRPALLSDAGFTKRFPAEAAVLASVDDPHVVRLYEYVESQSGAAVISELIDGASLRDILAHQGVTTAEAALVVLRDSLLGLAAAHRHGVAHRALKPQNVLISADGDGKLSDFGIAVRAEDSRVPAGTMVYAPPERFGGSPASPAGDVYAATAVFYECLAGRPPFARDTAERLVYQHLAEPVPLEPVPGPLRPLVAAGLATEPSNRPSDGSAFVIELTAVAAGAYGLDWQERGRSHLGEAALPLVTARWPSSSARPAVRDHGGYRFRRITGLRAVIAVGGVAAAAMAGTALAVSGPGAGTTASSVAAVQRVSLQPSARKPAATSAVPSSVSSPAAVQTSSPTRSSIPSGPALSPQPTPSRKPSGKPAPSPSPSPSVTPHPPSPLPVTPPVTPPPAPAPSPPSAPTSPPPSGLLGAAPIDL